MSGTDLTTIVIDRKIGQTIYIGDDVVLTVTKVRQHRASITIQCPRSWQVLRGEKLMNVLNRNRAKSTD